MKAIGIRSWPVLFISDQLKKETDEGAWLREIVETLTGEYGCAAMFASAYGDALDIVYSHEDLGAVAIDWENAQLGKAARKGERDNDRKSERHGEEAGDGRVASRLVDYVRGRNRSIPILILSDRSSVESLPNSTLEKVNGVIWKLTDTADFNAGRIERAVADYAKTVLPPFFGSLVDYVGEYNFAWHTPGHMGGQGFLKSPSGTAFHKFFGENMLRADLSISVPELGSLLDHSGVVGEAEAFSAKAFGADLTRYVLNGTSTGNQIVWRSRVSPGERCLVDRNCHKSIYHAMVATGAEPEYMAPVRNGLGMIGPVDFSSVDPAKRYSIAVLTNSTYDGICYDAAFAARRLAGAEALHFDEAWYAYARFHPLYAGRYAMSLGSRDRMVFSTQSTHKLLTALSQASMLHVRLPGAEAPSDGELAAFADSFNETYMMHGSTSPQYAMVASLEVATKMMRDNGRTALSDILEEAIELRRKMAAIRAEEEAEGDWFFGVWQPDGIAGKPTKSLIDEPGAWLIKPGDAWHGFPGAALEGEFAMLDPIKLTFLCPGVDARGAWADEGVPAAIVTRFLGDRGIVCEKSDYYSWLLLNSLGTTKGKQGSLLAELFRFREAYKADAPLDEVFPDLAAAHRARYRGQGLRAHCRQMHESIRSLRLLELLAAASTVLPTKALNPSDAHRAIVKGRVERVRLDELDAVARPRICAALISPYPPGIPLLMGGEALDARSKPILDYLLARQEFEARFPGYEGEIHGVEPGAPDAAGRRHFEMLAVREGS